MFEIRITPNFEDKTADISGVACAGEKVRVILKNCSTINTPTLRLRVLFFDKTLAVFPFEVTDGVLEGFTAEGEDLVCELNLCTDQALKTFRRLPELEVMFVLDDIGGTVRRMYFSTFHSLRGWPQDVTDNPVDLSTYKDRMKAFADTLDGMKADMDETLADFSITLEKKVDKVTGKGLSTIDATPELIGSLVQKSEFEAHKKDLSHVSTADRENWNAKAGKLDLVVQGGYLYVPDAKSGGWRRMQAMFDEEMGGVCTVLSEEMYIRREDGSFILEET